MRQDPDVILLGELRDAEVIRAAITAAETGQLVFSTMHTINAVQTLTRIIETFPAEQQGQIRFQLADLLRGVISQRLLPRKDGKGLVPAIEIMLPTAKIKKHILDNNINDIHECIKKGDYYGMIEFDDSLINLYNKGICTMEDVLEFSTNPDAVQLTLKNFSVNRDE